MIRMVWVGRSGRASLASLSITLAGCGPSLPAPGLIADGVGRPALAIDRAACQRDAVLLTRSVTVLAAPMAGASTVRILPVSAPIYLCGARGGYRAVMFPAPGQRADCSRRGGQDACPTGWISATTPVEAPG